MALCTPVQEISPTECMGDSLVKINNNFKGLSDGICNLPIPHSDDYNSTRVYQELTEQKNVKFEIETTNSFVYGTRFDSLNNGAVQAQLVLSDGSSLQTTTFPYHNTTTVITQKPVATFSTTALTDNPPSVTLYWTANGSEICSLPTLFNAASGTNPLSPISFNGSVTALLSSGNTLYVGGSFTEVGGVLAEKFVAIDLTTTSRGSISPITTISSLGTHGEVRKIVETTALQNNAPKKILAVGGTFENIGLRGRGLIIYNQTNDVYYPFYVNGEVNALYVLDNRLYVGGTFDYVNYGVASASTFSGQRLTTNGFFVINLTQLLLGVMRGALTDLSSIFDCECTDPVAINDIISYQSVVYLGGKFKLKKQNGLQEQQNICSLNVGGLNGDGTLNPAFKYLVNGPVYSFHLDNNIAKGGSVFLYVGGEFTKCYSATQYNSQPRLKNGQMIDFYNALAFKLTNQSSLLTSPSIVTGFKPKFDGPITRFASHDNEPDSHIYCYGRHLSVNGDSANYLVGISKAESSTQGKIIRNIWYPGLDKAPSFINQALIRRSKHLMVGGTFDRVGTEARLKLAEIPDTNQFSYNTTLSSFSFDVGAQIATPATIFSFPYQTFPAVRKVSSPLKIGQVNSTVFELNSQHFEGLVKGQLMRFFVRRPGFSNVAGNLPTNEDTFKSNVSVIGWKVDFNTK